MPNSGIGWFGRIRRLFGFGKRTAPETEVPESPLPGGLLHPVRANPVSYEATLLLRQGGLRSSPRGKGPQTGRLDRVAIDDYKRQMLDGSFFSDPNNKIAGYYDDGELIVAEGHHRVQASLELYQETGNAYYLNELIRFSMRGYTEPSGVARLAPVQQPAPLQHAPPPPGWIDGPFPPADPRQP